MECYSIAMKAFDPKNLFNCQNINELRFEMFKSSCTNNDLHRLPPTFIALKLSISQIKTSRIQLGSCFYTRTKLAFTGCVCTDSVDA